MKRIQCRLDAKSLLKAADKLNTLSAKLYWNTGSLVEMLATVGAAEAYASYQGEASVTTDVDYIKWKAKIQATADDIFVKEFGAGDAVDIDHPLKEGAQAAGVGIFPGSLSFHNMIAGVPNAGQYYKHRYEDRMRDPYWYYGDEKYTEIQPMYGMRNAREAILKAYKDVAKEVLLHD